MVQCQNPFCKRLIAASVPVCPYCNAPAGQRAVNQPTAANVTASRPVKDLRLITSTIVGCVIALLVTAWVLWWKKTEPDRARAEAAALVQVRESIMRDTCADVLQGWAVRSFGAQAKVVPSSIEFEARAGRTVAKWEVIFMVGPSRKFTGTVDANIDGSVNNVSLIMEDFTP